MDLGITGFHDLASANEKYIVSGKHLNNRYTRVFKKHIIALYRLAAIANLTRTKPDIICTIIPRKESKTVYPTYLPQSEQLLLHRSPRHTQ
jgi:hypothetical protein